MTKISTREFSRNPSGYIARVQGGETFELTRYDGVVAVLGPPQPSKDPGLETEPVTGSPLTRDELLRKMNQR